MVKKELLGPYSAYQPFNLSIPQSREERKAEAIMHMFENLERRKKRGQVTAQATAEETKLEAGEAEVPSAGICVPNAAAGGGVCTRRSSFATLVNTF